jgi:hypothetical protein
MANGMAGRVDNLKRRLAQHHRITGVYRGVETRQTVRVGGVADDVQIKA